MLFEYYPEREPEEEKVVYDRVDQHGKRYRLIGGYMKDYEPEININGFSVPESQADAFRAKLKKADEEYERKRLEEMRRKPTKSCPFKTMRDCANNTCDEECVMYSGRSCKLSLIGADEAGEDTKNRKCPLSGNKCNFNCAMHNNGCVFVKLAQRGV